MNENLELLFNELGIKTREENGEFRFFVEVMQDLCSIWNDLSEEKTNEIKSYFVN